MRAQFIAILIILVVFASCQRNALKHEPVKATKHCDTIYTRGQDPEVGDYYLIMEIICDTIEPAVPSPKGD